LFDSEGVLGVCGVAVLAHFYCGVAVKKIQNCGVAVISNPAVCGDGAFLLRCCGEKNLELRCCGEKFLKLRCCGELNLNQIFRRCGDCRFYFAVMR